MAVFDVIGYAHQLLGALTSANDVAASDVLFDPGITIPFRGGPFNLPPAVTADSQALTTNLALPAGADTA